MLSAIKDGLRGGRFHRAYRALFPASVSHGVHYERKRAIIVAHGRRYGLRSLVETGTCLGGTVKAALHHFEAIYTVELDEVLYRENVIRFASESSVTCYHGDSVKRLVEIVPRLTTSTLFWLDAHYSGSFEKDGRLIRTARTSKDSPIEDELGVILSLCAVPFVVLIDDAREFVGRNGYPTMRQLRTVVGSLAPATDVVIEDDIIRLYPTSCSNTAAKSSSAPL